MANDSAPQMFTSLPGLGLAVLIAAVSQVLSFGHAALDPLVLSMLISIILGNLLGPYQRFESGITLSHKLFIPLGIILYGTQMDLHPLQIYGAGRIFHILSMVVLGFLAIYVLSIKLGIAKKLSLLLAAGSVICGASAIMVLSPVIKAEKEDTSVSLLAITVIGLTGVIFYPLAQETLSLSEETYALLCGSTLYQMGQVKAAASLMGQNVIDMALPIKLLRIATLLPIAIAFSLFMGNNGKKIYVPWFIVGSLVTAMLTGLYPPLSSHRAAFAPYVSFFFSIAISGIGLSVDLESIIDVGPRPLLAAFAGWIVLLTLFVLGIRFIG